MSWKWTEEDFFSLDPIRRTPEWLRQLLKYARDEAQSVQKELDRKSLGRAKHNIRRNGFADGFKAGQEAMRERAASADWDVTGYEWVRGSLWDTMAKRFASSIRSLPIEEPTA